MELHQRIKETLISIIIPIHNRFSLVDETVKSVYDQTHRPIELIIVDDFSDELYIPKILSEPGFEIFILHHKQNKGPGASRETGRQAATGDFISYLDSDDLWHPEKLEKQVAMMQANPEAGMCYCTSREFYQLPFTSEEKIRKRSDQEYKDFLPAVLYGRPWGTGACLWTREAVDLIGPWFEGWVWEDYEYDCRAGCNEIKIVFLPEVLCYYRYVYRVNQFSKFKQKATVLHKAEAIKEINRHINNVEKLLTDGTYDRVLIIIYYQAMHLFYVNEKRKAQAFLNMFIKTRFSKKSILGMALIAISYITKSRVMGHILYKFRNQL